MSNKTFTLSLVMLLLALCAVAAQSSRSVPVVVQANLEKLPMVISGYTATEDSFSAAVYKELNADKNIYRHYKSQNGDQLDLYIGYYGTAKGGRTGHNPYACLPGSGAAIVDTGIVHLKQIATGKSIPVNYVLSRMDGANTVMLHWYQTAGKTVISTGLSQNIERFTGRILHNRNDGAFVRITANSADEDVSKTKQRVEQFAEIVLNQLPSNWPVEK
ncbi:MAG: EpsI family protein [Desulfuromonadaceae bacterium]|nr:EpsI family protein [Desulfuromonadaceae bacterium]